MVRADVKKWFLILVLGLVVLARVAMPAQADGTVAPVLAVYYAWYTQGSWNAHTTPYLPVSLYNSSSSRVMQEQIREAQSAGIDAFEVDWIGPHDSAGVDRNLRKLLVLAAQDHFHITAYVDLNFLRTPQAVTDALMYLARYYSDPGWFHFHGKPFVAFYHVASFPLATWRDIFAKVDPSHAVFWMGEGVDYSYLQIFDGMHPFSIAWAAHPGRQLAKFAAWTRAYPGKAWMATVTPGNNDTLLRGAQGFIVRRDQGNYYLRTWRDALATKPDLINITSWNEWFEGTQIEPGQTYGNLYLKLTRQERDVYDAMMGVTPTGANGCRFVLGFHTLALALGSLAGYCLENEHFSPVSGNSLQQTSTGLFVWRKDDNWTAFTDGYRTWVNGGIHGICERLNTQRLPWEANPRGLPVVPGVCGLHAGTAS